MKTKHFLSMGILALTLLGACSNNDELLTDVFGDDVELIEQAKKEPIRDVEKLPAWLRTVVESMHKEFVSVYVFEYKGTSYLGVEDMADSCYTCGNRFFTTKGVEITPEGDWTDHTGLYYELIEQDNHKQLIFSQVFSN